MYKVYSDSLMRDKKNTFKFLVIISCSLDKNQNNHWKLKKIIYIILNIILPFQYF